MYVADIGIRCERHASEQQLPDCGACATLSAEYRNLMRFGIWAPAHPGHHPLPPPPTVAPRGITTFTHGDFGATGAPQHPACGVQQ